MRVLALVLIAVVLSSCCLAQASAKSNPAARQPPAIEKPETSHLMFVTEFIRELAAINNVRASALKEVKQDSTGNVFAGAVHTGTLFRLELGAQIGTLGKMRLNAPYGELIPIIVRCYEEKIKLWQRMIDVSSALIVPKPDADIGKLTAEMAEVRAKIDFVDQTLFQTTPAVFITLIDTKSDSKGHTSHLIITKEERAKLLADLADNFGSKLDEPDQNYTVSAAKLVKDGLLKNFKCSDEPWD